MKEKTSEPDAGLYQAIIDSYLETGSVLKTSRALSVSEVKVRRVLLTEGLWSSRTSLQVQHYHNQNMTASQIAQLFHTTEKAVQQYMPYERGMYNKEDRTTDAQHSAIYRERMRRAKERTLKKAAQMAEEEGWKEMNSQYTQRDLSMERKTCVLHMELSHWEHPAPGQEFENEADRQAYEEYQRAVVAYREDTADEELRVLRTYGKLNSAYGMHPCKVNLPGVETSSGSLGHGLPIACGMAFSAKVKKEKHRVVVLLGDGESQEGTTWEAALNAHQYKLGNLVVFVDRNCLQLDDFTEEMMAMEPYAEKWKAFGWNVMEVDGHDMEQLVDAIDQLPPTDSDIPTAVICHTVKGKGVSFMENNPDWHAGSLGEEDMKKALAEVQAAWDKERGE